MILTDYDRENFYQVADLLLENGIPDKAKYVMDMVQYDIIHDRWFDEIYTVWRDWVVFGQLNHEMITGY